MHPDDLRREVNFTIDIQCETTQFSNETDDEIYGTFLSQSTIPQLQSPFDSNHKTPCMKKLLPHSFSKSL